MPTVTHEQALRIAMDHHIAGRLAEAEGIYRQLHGIYPNDPNIWNLLGVLALQTGPNFNTRKHQTKTPSAS